jgi:putative ubiquitin-RnfH superfamily antitoxin RatB of RatAB toxin-antitoxin module
MTTTIAGIVRRAAIHLADRMDKGPRNEVERELATDPLASGRERAFEPASFAALIVSLASFGWTV